MATDCQQWPDWIWTVKLPWPKTSETMHDHTHAHRNFKATCAEDDIKLDSVLKQANSSTWLLVFLASQKDSWWPQEKPLRTERCPTGQVHVFLRLLIFFMDVTINVWHNISYLEYISEVIRAWIFSKNRINWHKLQPPFSAFALTQLIFLCL